MRQFDVFPNPSPRSRGAVPYLLVMQSHFLDEMTTTLIAPLVREPRSGEFSRVSVAIEFDGEALHASLAEMAPILRASLRQAIGNASAYEFAIRRALDRLFTGF